MRRFHRWFGLVTAIFMIVISATGVVLQVQVLTEDHKSPPPWMVAARANAESVGQGANAPALAGGAGATPEGPAKRGGGDLHGLIMHIHSGEYFGKFANVVGLICGLALFFFSLSGLWMYWQMFSARAKIGRRDVFWR